MNNRFAAALLAGSALWLTTATARAQTTAPDFPAAPGTTAQASRAASQPADAARARRQQQMSPEDAARDQQLQVMEARTGNTTLGMARGGLTRQQDRGTGAFTLRKFKELPGQEQKKGETRRVLLGARTTGQPLVHKHKTKHKFLFF